MLKVTIHHSREICFPAYQSSKQLVTQYFRPGSVRLVSSYGKLCK